MGDNAANATQDPVCGKVVDPLRARAVGIYGGVTQYFCSPECKARYADPRQAEAAPPGGVERRARDEETGEHTGNWFALGAKAPEPEGFADLERQAPAPRPVPPTPSLLIEVEALKQTGRRRTWLWLVLGLAVGAVAIVGLWR